MNDILKPVLRDHSAEQIEESDVTDAAEQAAQKILFTQKEKAQQGDQRRQNGNPETDRQLVGKGQPVHAHGQAGDPAVDDALGYHDQNIWQAD